MKLLKTIIPAIALAALASSSAHAQTTTIHIAGSTAYRSTVHNAIARLLGGTGTAAYIGGNLAGANYAVFSGTVPGVTGTVVFDTFWSGSISGQNTLLNNPTTIAWLSPSTIPTTGATVVTAGGQTGFITAFALSPGAGGGNQLASSGSPTAAQTGPAAIADFAFSDAFQGSGPFKASSLLAGVSSSGTLSSGNGQGEEVGIIPFVWVKGAANTGDTDLATYNRIVNITSDQAKYLLGANAAAASFVTANSADLNVFLYITGRDGDSGTRLDALAESTYGIFSTTDQYTFAITAPIENGSANSNDVAGSSISNFNDFTYGLSQGVVPTNNVGGYNSGGTLAKAMAANNEDAELGGYIIGYLGVADADGLLAPNGDAKGTSTNSSGVVTDPTIPATYIAGSALTFNGAALTSSESINSGEYSFWTYEHFFARSTTQESSVPTGSQTYTTVPALLTVAGKLVSDIETTDAKVAGYLKSQVSASRTVEGGVITPGNM